MRHPVPARWAAAALLTAAIGLSTSPAPAADAPPAPGLSFWRSAGHVHAHVTLPGGAPAARGDRAPLSVFVLPDGAWDARRASPYLDRFSLSGAAVVELWHGGDGRLGLDEARAAIASAIEEHGLDPSRVALLGFGAGGRLALELAAPDRPAAVLYPVCHGAPVPGLGARVMVLHPDEPTEGRACAALVAGRPGARSGRPSAGAGHGWDAAVARSEGRVLLPHPDDAGIARRLPAHPDGRATFGAVLAVSEFLLSDAAARPSARGGPEP